MNDEHLYAQVAEELKRQGPNARLWAKAFAESNGVEPYAKALYLRYRVEQLAETERQAIQAAKLVEAEQARLDAVKAEEKRKAQAKAEGITPIHMILMGLLVIMFIIPLIVGLLGALHRAWLGSPA